MNLPVVQGAQQISLYLSLYSKHFIPFLGLSVRASKYRQFIWTYDEFHAKERERDDKQNIFKKQPGHDHGYALAYIDGMDNVYALMLKIYCLYNTLQNSPVPV